MEVIILFFLLLLSSSFPSPSSTTSTTTTSTINGGNETDMLSLVAFKNQLGSSSSSALSSWNATNHFCCWIGVTCSSTKKHPQRRRVTALDLSYLSLAGFVSPSLANLTFLTNLNLSNNGFYGTIPPQLNFMHHLQILDLSFNSLHGEIPIRLTNSSNLMKLNLTSNNISGKIPVELDSSKLRVLDLSNNSLTGEIPSSVGNLSSLMQFKVVINQLEGSIPYEIGRLQYLQGFGASVNNLSEYGRGGKVCTCGDVYSYGILLLEMFTGRRPVDHMFKDGYNLHEFVATTYPNRIMDIIDPLLLLQNDGEDSNDQGENGWSSRRGIQECIASVVSVGISCSKESPRERTNMRAAAMELHAIRDAFIRHGVKWKRHLARAKVSARFDLIEDNDIGHQTFTRTKEEQEDTDQNGRE